MERCEQGIERASTKAGCWTAIVQARKKKRRWKQIIKGGASDSIGESSPKDMILVRLRQAARAESAGRRMKKKRRAELSKMMQSSN